MLVARELDSACEESVAFAKALPPRRLLRRALQRIHGFEHGRRDGAACDLACEPARLFEVVGDDLDELVLSAGKRADPGGEPLVESDPAAFR